MIGEIWPKMVVLLPVSLAYWFPGDCKFRRKNHIFRVCLRLATCLIFGSYPAFLLIYPMLNSQLKKIRNTLVWKTTFGKTPTPLHDITPAKGLEGCWTPQGQISSSMHSLDSSTNLLHDLHTLFCFLRFLTYSHVK